MSVNSGLFPGPWSPTFNGPINIGNNTSESLFALQDAIADFKCTLAESVFCFNIE